MSGPLKWKWLVVEMLLLHPGLDQEWTFLSISCRFVIFFYIFCCSLFFFPPLFWMPFAACCPTSHLSDLFSILPLIFFLTLSLFFFLLSILIYFYQMFRDKLPTFRLACRLARWLCTDPERAATCKSNKDTMKRLTSIHAVLSRKAKMSTNNNHGKATKSCPASQGAVAIASLLHCIKDNALWICLSPTDGQSVVTSVFQLNKFPRNHLLLLFCYNYNCLLLLKNFSLWKSLPSRNLWKLWKFYLWTLLKTRNQNVAFLTVKHRLIQSLL